MTDKELVEIALEARKAAYAPYSHHKVGAALLCADGTVIKGCNIENTAYTPTNCAERTAIFKAISEGIYDFTKIAVVGGLEDADELDICAPCGVCRQVMMEFVNPQKFEIVLAKVSKNGAIEPQTTTLEDILPFGFGPANLLLEK